MIAWFGQLRNAPAVVEAPAPVVAPQQAIVVAKNAIPAGKPLQNEDITSKDVGPGEVLSHENILRGQETEFLGRPSQRAYTEGQPLMASDFIKPCTQLPIRPGIRAMSIFVDAAQSVAGFVAPGDYVDVLLTQDVSDEPKIDTRRKWAGETILRDVQVLATDQTLCTSPGVIPAISGSARTPQTVTLALKERQPEVLLVAQKLGTFQLVLRPHETAGPTRPEDEHKTKPVWASDVSPALTEFIAPPAVVSPPPLSCPPATGSPLEQNVRCAPSSSAYYRAPAPVAPTSQPPKPEPQGQWPGMHYAPAN